MYKDFLFSSFVRGGPSGLQHHLGRWLKKLFCSFSKIITGFLLSHPCVCSTLDLPLVCVVVATNICNKHDLFRDFSSESFTCKVHTITETIDWLYFYFWIQSESTGAPFVLDNNSRMKPYRTIESQIEDICFSRLRLRNHDNKTFLHFDTNLPAL